MIQPLRYIIVDDEEISRALIDTYASAFPFFQRIAVCEHALEAIEILSGAKADVVFADIEMPGISGIDLVKSIGERVAAPVFITSHPEFAIEGFEMNVFDYLLKPVSEERFEKCALRLKDFFQLRQQAFAFSREQESDFIIIRQGHDKQKLLLQDILYFEAMKDYTKIVT
ncbi:MAG: LytTR family DNA-binding domain-containing protein, partial [Chitinophagaceae bacterium]